MNETSAALKRIGMGGCVHEDLVQISYARVLGNHANDSQPDTFLNPWASRLHTGNRYAQIAEVNVGIGEGKTFTCGGSDHADTEAFAHVLDGTMAVPGPASTKPNSSPTPNAAPKTGDPITLGALGAALVAAGTAVVAYERRRAENEAADAGAEADESASRR